MNKNTIFITICILIAVGVLGRLLPHAPNATPITALALVGSMYFGRKGAMILPLGILFLTDLIIGFYSLGIMLSVYGSFFLIALASKWLQTHRSVFAVFYTIIGASLTFFLVTNTAVWWFSPWYEKSLSGLLYSYELGLPFLRNMFIGDMVYTYTLLGALALAPYLAHSGKKVPLLLTHLFSKAR